MRHYLVDEISPPDMDKIKGFLNALLIEQYVSDLIFYTIGNLLVPQ